MDTFILIYILSYYKSETYIKFFKRNLKIRTLHSSKRDFKAADDLEWLQHRQIFEVFSIS